MGYIANLKSKWSVTNEEQKEIDDLKRTIEIIDGELYFGNYNQVSFEDIGKAKKAEARIREIKESIKKRRINALLGKQLANSQGRGHGKD